MRSAQVVLYVDGTRVGEAQAAEETPHHIIHRLCELDLAVSDLQQPPQQKGVGFRLKLPNLMQGKHEVSLSLLVPLPDDPFSASTWMPQCCCPVQGLLSAAGGLRMLLYPCRSVRL